MVLLVLAACTDASPAETPDASPAMPDAPYSMASCDTGEYFSMHGAFDVEVASAGRVTSGGHVIAVVGAATPQRFYSLSLRHILTDNFDTVGDYDISAHNMKYFEEDHGFFALAGTVHVTQTTPRFRATFELTDLHHHDDQTDTMGAPIAGSVTGCVNANTQ
ncbi:MAG TPA: hypothetical protein VL326_28250 [Kofleriaceae bacterium]|jgi:hypothetical protein|nr:hypothetical protein [Kofleriaceae bacterium]